MALTETDKIDIIVIDAVKDAIRSQRQVLTVPSR